MAYVFWPIYGLVGIGFAARNYDADSRYGKTIEAIGNCCLIPIWPIFIGALLSKKLQG